MNIRVCRHLQRDLETVFRYYDVDVTVGITREGIAIRSQDKAVDATNVGALEALEAVAEPAGAWVAVYVPGKVIE